MSTSNESRRRPDGTALPKDVSFAPVESGHGVEVLDLIDRHRYILWTPDPVSHEPADVDRFSVPVDAAVSIPTRAVTLPTVVPVYIRDDEGSFIASVEQSSSESLPEGTYGLELAAPIKLYLRVHGEITVSSDLLQTYIDFGEETEVLVGACSYHEKPAATATTTDDPRELMAAVSTFGSALKTRSPERSFPSNRGHPPVIKRGDALRIPAGLEAPETSVRLEVPAEHESIYAAAPLAYYLGAPLVPADAPRLVTDTGFEYALDEPPDFGEAVERVLKRVFFLDCVVRTEGVHPVDLHERVEVEPHLGYDYEFLYNCPPAERLEAYFDAPYSLLEAQIPDWNVTAHVDPAPENAEVLPFVAHRLAAVRTSPGREISPPNEREAIVDEYLRNGSGAEEDPDGASAASYVRPERTGALEEVWVGDGIPLGATKALPEAYRNQIGRLPTEGDIEITVVYNEDADPDAPDDPETNMIGERNVVDEVYGSRLDLPFDTTIHHDLTVDELRSVLRTPTDFLHYIGHIDGDGMRCADGKLDAATLETVGADAFFLNACQSYEQGTHLIRGGSIGGIVTLGDVFNSEAIRMGRTIARLLNRGFPLYAAHGIARDVILHGGQYQVLGDGGFVIAQAESSVVNMCEIKPQNGSFEVTIVTYPGTRWGMGAMYIPYIESNDKYFLSGGPLSSFNLTEDELRRFLALEDVPIRINGELHWSYDVDVATL